MQQEDLVILTDFDGTVSLEDLADLVLQKYVREAWEDHTLKFRSGEIGYKDHMSALENLFRLVDGNRDEIWGKISNHTELRPNFGSLIDFCNGRFPVVITSLGLDFIIRRIISENKWAGKVGTHIPETRMSGNGIEFLYPEPEFRDSTNLKDDKVRHFKDKGRRVVYIGNGESDFPAALIADVVFAVKNDSLAHLCRDNDVEFHEFSDFSEVLEVVTEL